MNDLLNRGCGFYGLLSQFPKPVAAVMNSKYIGGFVELCANPAGFIAMTEEASLVSPECKLNILDYLPRAGYTKERLSITEVRDPLNLHTGWHEGLSGLIAIGNRLESDRNTEEFLLINDKCALAGHEVSFSEAVRCGRADHVGASEELIPLAIGWINDVSETYRPTGLIGDKQFGPFNRPPNGTRLEHIGQVTGAHMIYGQTYTTLSQATERNNAAIIQAIIESYAWEEKARTTYNQVREITGVESFLALREAA